MTTRNNQTKSGSSAFTNPLTAALTTSLASVLGTATLVGAHHCYRKRRQPNARLSDYLTGIRHTALNAPNAAQQALQAWQAAMSQNTEMTQDSRQSAEQKEHRTVIIPRPVSWVSGVAAMAKNSPLADKVDSGFGVVGIDSDRQLVWQTTMPERVHDIVVQPLSDGPYGNAHQRHVVVMGRRPSERFWVLDAATGHVQFAITAVPNRHFYGHACYSVDGTLLYVTENDTVSLNGKIGIYAVSTGYQKIAEFDSYGIGPHELIMHPDGDTLVVANGGIKTEQASREELNLDSMRPALAYLNRYTGALLEQVQPEHNQMSIRHLDIHDDGRVMIGIQFQGARHINVPLVLTHKRGDRAFTPLSMPDNGWQRFHQYIASVAVDSERDILCVTTPIGGCAALFDLQTGALIDSVALPDCAGAAVIASDHGGFIISDGQGQLTTLQVVDRASVISDSTHHQMSFDNHLQAL